MSEESEKIIADLKDAISIALEYRDLDLVTDPSWGSINFQVYKEDYENIYKILLTLDGLPVEHLLIDIIRSITQQVASVNRILGEIKDFKIDIENPQQKRDALGGQLKSAYSQLFNATAQWIPFLAYQQGDASANITKLEKSIETASGLVTEAKEDIEQRKGELDVIIAKAREASAAAGAAVFTHEFNNEAKSNQDTAKIWLKLAGGFAIVTIIIAVILSIYWPDASGKMHLLQLLVNKVLIIGLFLVLTLWCANIYKGYIHLRTVNKNKALALQTFQAFVQATNNPQVKDAVLIETTRTIFENYDTGFIGSTSKGTDSSLKILEMIKGVSKTD